jgi:hypothetical protein
MEFSQWYCPAALIDEGREQSSACYADFCRKVPHCELPCCTDGAAQSRLLEGMDGVALGVCVHYAVPWLCWRLLLQSAPWSCCAGAQPDCLGLANISFLVTS